jgi:ring-1,2-phenylacetyl-CoA epoxidase subunit PaaD
MNDDGRWTEETLRAILGTIPDPEVPAISIVELGLIRGFHITDDEVTVTVTPTYSGCPAMDTIRQEIRRVLNDHGIDRVSILTVLTPAWTTDWIGEEAKQRLHQYGIAPPHPVASSPLLQIELPPVACPHCRSLQTTLKSEFGSTACKAYYHCDDCRQPFEYFKSF